MKGKEEERERKVRARRRHVTFVTGKVIGGRTASINKSCWRRRGKLRR